MITQGELRNQIEFCAETGLWRWREPEARPNRKKSWFSGAPITSGYLTIRVDGKTYYAHTLAWLYVYGDWFLHLDHANRDKGDNRISNLRMSSKSTNAINAKMREDNSSGHVGISRGRPGKWIAYINKDGVRKSKSFSSFDDAVEWRRKMQDELFGPFVPKIVASGE